MSLSRDKLICDVTTALFESYINMRKNLWNITDEEIVNIPEKIIPAYKIKTCISLLQTINRAKGFNAWLEAIYLLDEKERIENTNKSSDRFFGLAKYFVDKPLLLLTLAAAKSYIISQLIYNPEFSEEQNKLKHQKSEIEKAILQDELRQVSGEIIANRRIELKEVDYKIDSLNNSKEFINSFFEDILLERDAKTKELNEKTFSDYEKNVSLGLRKQVMCEKLIACHKPDEKNNLQAASLSGEKNASPMDSSTDKLSEDKNENNKLLIPEALKSDVNPDSTKEGKKSPLLTHSAFPLPRKTNDDETVKIIKSHTYNLRRF